MGYIDVISEREFDDPVLVDGLPGVGLVGKIVADHLVEALDMDLLATVHCDALPAAAAYAEGDRTVTSAVRLYAAADADVVVLQSDVPVSAEAAEEFADCIEGWYREQSVTPLYIAGLGREEEDDAPPSMRGVAVGEGEDLFDGLDVPVPESAGLVSGPTGALLAHSFEADLPAVGLIVDVDPQFPDPGAARVVLEDAVEPITGVGVNVETLEAQAERIQRAKEQLAEQLREQEEDVSQARRLRMYQ